MALVGRRVELFVEYKFSFDMKVDAVCHAGGM